MPKGSLIKRNLCYSTSFACGHTRISTQQEFLHLKYHDNYYNICVSPLHTHTHTQCSDHHVTDPKDLRLYLPNEFELCNSSNVADVLCDGSTVVTGSNTVSSLTSHHNSVMRPSSDALSYNMGGGGALSQRAAPYPTHYSSYIPSQYLYNSSLYLPPLPQPDIRPSTVLSTYSSSQNVLRETPHPPKASSALSVVSTTLPLTFSSLPIASSSLPPVPTTLPLNSVSPPCGEINVIATSSDSNEAGLPCQYKSTTIATSEITTSLSNTTVPPPPLVATRTSSSIIDSPAVHQDSSPGHPVESLAVGQTVPVLEEPLQPQLVLEGSSAAQPNNETIDEAIAPVLPPARKRKRKETAVKESKPQTKKTESTRKRKAPPVKKTQAKKYKSSACVEDSDTATDVAVNKAQQSERETSKLPKKKTKKGAKSEDSVSSATSVPVKDIDIEWSSTDEENKGAVIEPRRNREIDDINEEASTSNDDMINISIDLTTSDEDAPPPPPPPPKVTSKQKKTVPKKQKDSKKQKKNRTTDTEELVITTKDNLKPTEDSLKPTEPVSKPNEPASELVSSPSESGCYPAQPLQPSVNTANTELGSVDSTNIQPEFGLSVSSSEEEEEDDGSSNERLGPQVSKVLSPKREAIGDGDTTAVPIAGGQVREENDKSSSGNDSEEEEEQKKVEDLSQDLFNKKVEPEQQQQSQQSLDSSQDKEEDLSRQSDEIPLMGSLPKANNVTVRNKRPAPTGSDKHKQIVLVNIEKLHLKTNPKASESLKNTPLAKIEEANVKDTEESADEEDNREIHHTPNKLPPKPSAAKTEESDDDSSTDSSSDEETTKTTTSAHNSSSLQALAMDAGASAKKVIKKTTSVVPISSKVHQKLRTSAVGVVATRGSQRRKLTLPQGRKLPVTPNAKKRAKSQVDEDSLSLNLSTNNISQIFADKEIW